MSSHCNAHVGARLKADALSQRVFLEHDADGVNDFLVQAGVTIDDHLMRSLGRGAPFGSDHPKSSPCSFAREPAVSEG